MVGQLKKLVDEGYADKRYEISQLKRDLEDRNMPYEEIPFTTQWEFSLDKLNEQLAVIFRRLSLGKFDNMSLFMQSRLLDAARGFGEEGNGCWRFAEEEHMIVMRK